MSNQAQVKWDFSRFLATLNYFGEIPFIGSFRWLQQWMGQSDSFPGVTLSAMKKKVLIVGVDRTSATESRSELSGAELTKLLQQKLGESADLLWCEWPHQPEPELPEPERPGQKLQQDDLQTNAGAFRASAQKTSSKLAALIRSVDTVVILGTVDVSDWMTDALDVVTQRVFDFSSDQCDLSAWGSLDDVVMGGVSQGSFFKRGSEAVFAGSVSTDNSGGFSSVRTKNFEPPFNFSGWHGVKLRVKGDGQRYKFIARNSGGWDSPAYIYGIDTVKDEWVEVCIPFEQMVPTFRARSVPDAPMFDPAKVFSFQLMLSKFEYDRQLNPSFVPGAFELLVSDLSVYRPRKGVPIVVVGSSDESSDAQQRSALDDANVDYRFVELAANQPDAKALSEAIAQSLV